jgi:hypothetical protein
MKVRTSNPRCVNPDDTLTHATKLLGDLDIGALPVLTHRRATPRIREVRKGSHVA